MFSLVGRYLATSFILPFVVSASFFIVFLLTFQLFKIVRIVVNKGVEVGTVVELLGHIALSFVPMAIPLSVLFASIYTLNKLSADSEFLAMRSFGFSRAKLIRPFLIMGIIIGSVTFALNSKIVPYSKNEFKKALTILTSKGLLTDIKKGQFFTDVPNVMLFAEDVQRDGEILNKVFIHTQDKNGKRIINANNGELIKVGDSKWGAASLRLKLSKGNITMFKENSDEVEKVLFETYEFPLTKGAFNVDIGTKDSMRSTESLLTLMNERDAKRKPGVKKTKDEVKTEIEFFTRINNPLLCIVFAILGFALGVQHTRGQARSTSSQCLAILVIYYVLYFAGVSMARKGLIPSSVAVFLPTILGLGAGGYFYRKLEWIA